MSKRLPLLGSPSNNGNGGAPNSDAAPHQEA